MDRYVNLLETMRSCLLFGALLGFLFLVQYSSILSSLFVPTKSEMRTSSIYVVNSKDRPYFVELSPLMSSGENDSTTLDDFDGSSKDSSTSLDDDLNDGIDPEDEFDSPEGSEKVVRINRFPVDKKPASVMNEEIHKLDISSQAPPKISNGNAPPVPMEENSTAPELKTMSVSQMKDMLLQSRSSYPSPKPKWPSIADQELFHAKTLITTAPNIEQDPRIVSLYRNFSEFKR
ncbi:hypothetical protein M569_08206 [Genlisea aurea]|uniref:Uncharacterized protein n=1 Tax=Genlisea aurea TaxID=192259 RepID=S8CIL1_9LAMI|nr:hypothetical protein M569_08206 [Genlisea aurea]